MSDKLLTHQRGMTMISWMLVIAIALFFLMIGMKMVPTYIENYSIKEVLTSVQQDRSLRKASRAELQKIILRRFKINSVYDFRKEDLSFTKEKQGLRVGVDYEVRKPVVANVFVVMAFKDSVLLDR
jgi:Tfp pilus assembly major pilin PilA